MNNQSAVQFHSDFSSMSYNCSIPDHYMIHCIGFHIRSQFSLRHCVQTGSGAHAASYPNGKGGS
jgi:hypothetical protein